MPSVIATKLIPKFVTKASGRALLKLQKNSPHILFGAGIAGVVGGTVLACRATLKLHETLDEFTQEVQAEKPTASNADMAYIYGKNTAKLVKLYAPAVIVGGAGLACLTGSHVQLTRRNNVLTVTYAGLLKAYDEYRKRVREEVGEEKEIELFHGIETQEMKLDGKTIEAKIVDPNKLSQYTRIFDELNPNYRKDAEINKIFIQCQQNYFNMMLQTRGHVFLNEVYEHLGFEHSRPGAVVGWVLGNGDNYINFHLYEASNSRFINGDERAIVMDFNVDGVILDLIK